MVLKVMTYKIQVLKLIDGCLPMFMDWNVGESYVLDLTEEGLQNLKNEGCCKILGVLGSFVLELK